MASIITATNSSGLTQSADNSGVLQLASGTGNLVTIPSVTGTAMVSGNMPAFSAYMGAGQSLSNGSLTKVAFDTEQFDTNNNYDTTNYRFTPTVAGYYQINVSVYLGGMYANSWASIYKNGGEWQRGNQATQQNVNVSSLIYCNGSTDYIEAYAIQTSGSTQNIGAYSFMTFSGSMTRAA